MKVERDQPVPPKPTLQKPPAPPNSHMAVERAYGQREQEIRAARSKAAGRLVGGGSIPTRLDAISGSVLGHCCCQRQRVRGSPFFLVR